MKKTIGLLLLLLANVALLAHAVIPHHHHPHEELGAICYPLPTADHPDSDQTDHPSYEEREGHAHGNNGLGDRCVLNELYRRYASGESSSAEDDVRRSPDLQDLFCLICCIDRPALYASGDDGALSLPPKPYLLSSYNLYATRSSGLRAPPPYLNIRG